MRSTHLDVVDRVRAEEVLERVNDLLTRLDRESPGAEPYRLVIAVGPFNIDRGRSRVAGADCGRLLQQLRGGGGRGAPAEGDAHRAGVAELGERAGLFHHERSPVLAPVARAVAAG